jgi:hypothetical protein
LPYAFRQGKCPGYANEAHAISSQFICARRRSGLSSLVARSTSGRLCRSHAVLAPNRTHDHLRRCCIRPKHPRMVRNVSISTWRNRPLTYCICRVEEVETPQLLDAWVKTLDLIEALKPEQIIAGHCTYTNGRKGNSNHVAAAWSFTWKRVDLCTICSVILDMC